MLAPIMISIMKIMRGPTKSENGPATSFDSRPTSPLSIASMKMPVLAQATMMMLTFFWNLL